MKNLYLIFVLFLWQCDRHCGSDTPQISRDQQKVIAYVPGQTSLYNFESYFIRCNSKKETSSFVPVPKTSSEGQCEDYSYTYYQLIADFTSDIPVDPLSTISTIRMVLKNSTSTYAYLTITINTSNAMSETYTCKMKIEKPNLDKLDFIDKNINSEYIDSYYQNNIRYHGVNKIYKTTKSFIDTIFYSTGAGFIKFVINQKEYIVK